VIGKKLGHYKATSQLGKGGMGLVYQAKDQKLGRDAAIKVLPEECILSYLLFTMSRKNAIGISWRNILGKNARWRLTANLRPD